MGLDILIVADNHNELRTVDYYKDESNFDSHSLSRTFCYFMCRKDVINGEAELDQIGRITGVDISPIYAMEKYWDEDGIDHQLSFAETEDEREEILNRIQRDKDNLKSNIDLVLLTIESLIQKLSGIDDLDRRLNDNGRDTLDYKSYFTDFNVDKGQGYIDNNFGQDLRNFKRFLEFAKSKGTTSVWFNYG